MKRRKTREVMVGSIGVGGENPIRIQSMTTSDTRDIAATVDQIVRLSDAGCEIARVTVQGQKEAQACGEIKNALIQRGYTIPLVADIHFYPPAAMTVVDFVDKVRINPGNFADRRATFRIIEYTESSYSAELDRIEEVFAPFVDKCKRLKKPIRIGTNHGSLSDRIMNRYGDTAKGMVESALEYTRIAEKRGFHDLIFSMKASNTLVMIEAYRMLVEAFGERDYPLHLGVTEAGDGEDGRVKSAIGIGALLIDGIGDTIRVSITEDPWCEVDPCQRLIALEERATVSLPPKRGRSIPVKVITDPSGFAVCDALTHRVDAARTLASQTDKPILLDFDYRGLPAQEVVIRAAAEMGSLLCDGIGEGIRLTSDLPPERNEALALSILQGCRLHFSKTEFIACPGCGRTLFDIQSVTKKIRERTGHLPGVKIAIMGCIVNGPGEMADADFGYVGSRTGKVDLYVGRECVERSVDQEIADERLIELIKSQGKWQELEAVALG